MELLSIPEAIMLLIITSVSVLFIALFAMWCKKQR